MPRRKPVKPYLDSPIPLAIAHRGFSENGLENSLPAFLAAVELGFSYVESDINSTADGVAVMFHDSKLDRVTDHLGAISALPYSAVEGVRIQGVEAIPTLREFIAALPGVRLNIDVKDAGSVIPLAAAIEEYGLHDRVCVASFSGKRSRAVLSLLTKPVARAAGKKLLAVYFLLESWLPKTLLSRLMQGVDVLQIPPSYWRIDLVTPARLRRAHALGLKVHLWTVNEPSQMNRFLDLGVDGIMTDRADLLASIMRERGYWPR